MLRFPLKIIFRLTQAPIIANVMFMVAAMPLKRTGEIVIGILIVVIQIERSTCRRRRHLSYIHEYHRLH